MGQVHPDGVKFLGLHTGFRAIMANEKMDPIPKYPGDQNLTSLQQGCIEALEVAAELAGAVIPGLSYGKEKILNKFVRGPLEDRRSTFHERIAAGLEHLEAVLEGFDPGSLGDNEDFISAVYEATQIAMKTSREEKRDLAGKYCS